MFKIDSLSYLMYTVQAPPKIRWQMYTIFFNVNIQLIGLYNHDKLILKFRESCSDHGQCSVLTTVWVGNRIANIMVSDVANNVATKVRKVNSSGITKFRGN